MFPINKMRSSLFLVFSLASVYGVLAQPQCGKQAGGAYCTPGFCCNSTGYCGVTDDYCASPGCQSQCHREECGWQSGGRVCADDLCCSHDGFCGATDPWCGPGCQSQCHTPSPPSPAPTPSPGVLAECGKQAGGAYCAPGFCCNSTGYCGVTDDYCASPGCQSQCHREECGWQSGGRVCADDLCCSHDGFCGATDPWCGPGCQSQCHTPSPPSPAPTPSPPTPPTPSPPSPTPSDSVSSIITSAIFEQMFPYRNDGRCQGNGFYTYDAFIAAANSFSGFGTTGDINTRKRELAAFLAQTSHETTGGWPDAPDGPYAWGYCYVEETNRGQYCTPSQQWPCAPGKSYYGRGPIQISHNYNYGPAGTAPQINYTLLSDPDAVARDAIISFKTAIWFWMTQQPPKPSCHDVITGVWIPSATDSAAGRLPGYGTVTNIINGGVECGKGYITPEEADRIGFYTTYSQKLDVSPGDNLNCSSQQQFGLTKSVVIPESVIA